jgi:hypothetical protein
VIGAVTETIEEPDPAGARVTLGGLKLVVNWEKLSRDTVPENPFKLARSIFALSEPPCARVI